MEFKQFLLFPILLNFVIAQNGPENGAKKKLKILIYSPTLGWSHTQFMGQVADTLADAGHEVHFIRLIMNPRFRGVKETQKAHKVYEILPEKIARMDVNKISGIDDPFSGVGICKLLFKSKIWPDINAILTATCEEIVTNKELIAQLEAEQFDVSIGEIYDLCPFAFFHRIGVRTQLSALATPIFQSAARRFGIPVFASYVTDMVCPMEGAPMMNFWERIINFYNAIYDYYFITDSSVEIQKPIVQKAFGSDFPELKQIARNISLIFVNSNPFFEMPRPISNKVIPIGGLVEMTARPLDSNLAEIMENANANVVLISFGTVVETQRMNAHIKTIFLRAFAMFPDVTFIWKLDVPDGKAHEQFSTNVHAVKWMDQKSLLLHPKVRAFITHCGMNSVSEAARAGKPILGIPIFGDQQYNAIMAKRFGIGILVDIRRLQNDGAEHLIAEALEKVLNEPKYRQSAELVAKKFALTPFRPSERLVKWVEFAAEFPPLNELNLPWEDELGLLAYYSLDVILFTLALIGAVVATIFMLFKLLLRKLRALIWKNTNRNIKIKNN